jgi:hypothetical protein
MLQFTDNLGPLSVGRSVSSATVCGTPSMINNTAMALDRAETISKPKSLWSLAFSHLECKANAWTCRKLWLLAGVPSRRISWEERGTIPMRASPMHTVTPSSVEGLADEYAWLDGSQNYIACCFYTDNYLARALALKHSLDEFGINHYFKHYEQLGSWEANTRIKPAFIQHCLELFPGRDVLYVDADAVVRRPLEFVDRLSRQNGSDVALWLHPRRRKGRWYLRITASVVYIRNTANGFRFVRGWRDAEKALGPLAVDEDMLQAAFADFEGLSITVLPSSYVKIFDENRFDAVIEQFQASREQFNWRSSIRKTRQFATFGAGAMLLLSLIWLLWWL